MKALVSALLLLGTFAAQAESTAKFRQFALQRENSRRLVTTVQVDKQFVMRTANAGADEFDVRGLIVPHWSNLADATLQTVIGGIPEVSATLKQGGLSLYGRISSFIHANELFASPTAFAKNEAAVQAFEREGGSIDISLINVQTFNLTGYFQGKALQKVDRCLSYGGHAVELLVRTSAGNFPLYYITDLRASEGTSFEDDICIAGLKMRQVERWQASRLDF